MAQQRLTASIIRMSPLGMASLCRRSNLALLPPAVTDVRVAEAEPHADGRRLRLVDIHRGRVDRRRRIDPAWIARRGCLHLDHHGVADTILLEPGDVRC